MTLRLLLLLGLLASTTRAADDLAMADRLVHITATYQIQNPFLPWQYAEPANRTGYGIMLAPGEVLTTEHLVRNYTHVEMLRARTGEKITASVIAADPRLNLALLHVPTTAAYARLPPLLPGGPMHEGQTVTVAQFNDDDDLQTVAADVSQIGVTMLPDSPFSVLTYALLTRLNVDGEGAPVLCSNTLAGVVIAYQPSSRIGTMIGAPFISRFLTDVRTPPYRGPASAGFTWRPLADPAKRAWLRMGDEHGGMQVVAPLRGTGADGSLRSLDVILEWDGYPLDSLGYYQDPDFGRLEFSHLVKGKGTPGDHVPLVIWRDGARQTVQLVLGGDSDRTALVPENVAGARAPYLVTGGLVMRELDMNMLRALGQDWRAKADPELLHAYLVGRPNQQPGDRVVVLIGVLPDDINVGYQQLRNRIVTAVNQSPVRNLHDVFAVADRDGLIDRVTVQGMGVDLVLDHDTLPAANLRIARQYRVPALEDRGSLESVTPLLAPARKATP